jgi:hypothetical protein
MKLDRDRNAWQLLVSIVQYHCPSLLHNPILTWDRFILRLATLVWYISFTWLNHQVLAYPIKYSYDSSSRWSAQHTGRQATKRVS